MSFAVVNGREIGRKVEELLTGLAVAYVASAVIEAVTELNFKPIAEVGGDLIDWLIE